MDKYLKRTYQYIVVAILVGVVSLLATYCIKRHLSCNEPNVIENVVVKTDTIRIPTPIAVHDTLIKYVYVKVPLSQQSQRETQDTITQETQANPTEAKKTTGFSGFSDTVEVVLPITQKEYSDSNYRAWVSGFMPNLDSIRIYQRTTGRSFAPKPSRLHLVAGAGITFNGRVEPSLFVGVGWSFYEIKLK